MIGNFREICYDWVPRRAFLRKDASSGPRWYEPRWYSAESNYGSIPVRTHNKACARDRIDFEHRMVKLDDGELHVWQGRLDISAASDDCLCSILSPAELARANRFHFEHDRRRFRTGRATLRTILARYLDCRPNELSLVFGSHGKPMLQGAELEFNLTHCDDLAMIAVSRAQTGIDLERVRPISEMAGVMAMFSVRERLAIEALPADDRIRGFFRC